MKQSENEVYLPHYYCTHPHGYKMRVCVNPKGNLDGKGSHVSIYNHMMQGPFDDCLKWPFQGERTIQIVNQPGDHNHLNREWTFHYTDTTPGNLAGRVTNLEMAEMGWGRHKCLAHDELKCEISPF